LPIAQSFADRTFTRAAGAPLVEGNHLRLLEDARENYPAWLEAIGDARRHVHFENYIIRDDDVGALFADAFVAKAREGVRVRVIYDWMGALGTTSRAFWSRLRAAGVEVRCYNPPRLSAPLGWLSRDHRKTLEVDGRIAFVSGLCVGSDWVGDVEKQLAPWRDTGVMLRGPAVAEVQRAFVEVWRTMGEPVPAEELVNPEALLSPEGLLGPEALPWAGDTSVRVVATSPASGGLFRVDKLVAALARHRLWIADAYFAGTPVFVEALCASARDGVDVRLLVPGESDIPLLKPLSRAGYRPLLQGGVRVFEWNGSMMHAKTAVADGLWARVGSTNLNFASWFGNYEMDVIVEDADFAHSMEQAYLRDLGNATELTLDAEHRTSRSQPAQRRSSGLNRNSGSAGRAAAGTVRIGNAVSAACTNRRVLEPVEGRLLGVAGAVLLTTALLFAFFPRLVAYPLALLLAWIALACFHKSFGLRARRGGSRSSGTERLGFRPRSEA
jgi:cardiolipin synthase